MIREKINQAYDILREENIDCWLTFVRESSTTFDPAMDLVVGTGVTWQSAFILTAKGDSIAIVGSLDKANQKDQGHYDQIIGYVQSVEDDLVKTLQKINPNKIAVNYSLNTATADGLTHGLYLQLIEYLKKVRLEERIISSEPILNKLRGRKSGTEVSLVEDAIKDTLIMFDQVGEFIRSGRTEKQIARS